MNRAVARRTLVENGADVARFFEGVGRVVERGWLEVHSYTLLTTHFHALVRSPCGELSRALHEVQTNYVRHFNRSRRRDGPLLRGRFRSQLVDSHAYRKVLVGYIDANAPRAGLVASAADHRYGSCRDYVVGPGPAWLQRDWVEGEVCAALGLASYRGDCYPDVFQRGFTDAHGRWMERRLARSSRQPDPVDSLLAGASPAVLDWLHRKAALADGTRPGLAIVPQAAVRQAMTEQFAAAADAYQIGVDSGWRHASACEALLLREFAGLKFDEIGHALHLRPEAARRLLHRARDAFRRDRGFAATVAQLGELALGLTYGRSPVSVRA